VFLSHHSQTIVFEGLLSAKIGSKKNHIAVFLHNNCIGKLVHHNEGLEKKAEKEIQFKLS